MKNPITRALIVFAVFFTAAAAMITLDNICKETTGEGGKLILDIDNTSFFQ